MKITKEEIQKNSIFISKDVLSENDRMTLWHMAHDAPYTYGHKTDLLSNDSQKRLASNLNSEIMENSEIIQKLVNLFQEPVTFKKGYINIADCATKTLAHCDNYTNSPSILIPMNAKWEREWGGYTVFFEGMDSNEIVKSICPAPGNVVIFNGSMWHLALPPSMGAPYPRFMMALKFEYSEELKQETKP